MITIRTSITIQTPMTVKELGPYIGKTAAFIYKMRLGGFPMKRTVCGCFEATPEQAVRWIKKNKFRLVRGRVKKG